jgi:hypothetical protein
VRADGGFDSAGHVRSVSGEHVVLQYHSRLPVSARIPPMWIAEKQNGILSDAIRASRRWISLGAATAAGRAQAEQAGTEQCHGHRFGGGLSVGYGARVRANSFRTRY